MFVFDNLIFQLYRKFLAAEKISSDQNEDYQVSFKTNEKGFKIKQLSNCLFLPDNKCNPESVKVFPNSGYGSIIFWSSLILFLMVLFVTFLLLIKFGFSSLLGKSNDPKSNELKRNTSLKCIKSSDGIRSDSQLGSSKQTSKQSQTPKSKEEPIKKKDKHNTSFQKR